MTSFEETSRKEEDPSLAPDLLPIGKIASRHLIAHTRDTDIYAQSIEQVVSRAENMAEVRATIEAVTQPYERLFLSHAASQPRKGEKTTSWPNWSDNARGRRVGGWQYTDASPTGLIWKEVDYAFSKSRKIATPLVAQAIVRMQGRGEDPAMLNLYFHKNRITQVDVGWGSDHFHTPTRHPETILSGLKGSQLGELIDLTLQNRPPTDRGSKYQLSFRMGEILEIITQREWWLKNSGGGHSRFSDLSNFVYDPDANYFKRHKGLGSVDENDSLTSLSNEEFVNILYELLRLVPAVDLGPA